MDKKAETFILNQMQAHNIMTLATVRPDGYPQATTVAYANDQFTIYFGCAKDSQKIRNIRYSNKVSLTIDHDYEDWSKIKGLSMSGSATILDNRNEMNKAVHCLERKFKQLAEMTQSIDPEQVALVKITPRIISVLNYEEGFGHSDLINVSEKLTLD